MRGIQWTEDEDSRLKELRSSQSIRWVARLLNRPAGSVKTRLRKLGLQTPKPKVKKRKREVLRVSSQTVVARVIRIIFMLKNGKYTPKSLAERFEICERTVYRYFDLIEELGLPVENDFNGRFFIVECECPFCKVKSS